jgi:hypothetical protein
MRLEELENDRDRQKEKSEALHEASLKHRQQVEQLGMHTGKPSRLRS